METAKLLNLISIEKSDQCYWKVGIVSSDNIDCEDDESYIECYRKDLVGFNAAKEIKNAIYFHLNNLINECNNDGLEISISNIGFSGQIPLYIIEEIYDFWFEAYKNPLAWKKSKGLINLRYNQPLNNSVIRLGLKGISKIYAEKIYSISNFKSDIISLDNKINKPMW